MNRTNPFRNALMALALIGFGAPPAGAFEIIGAASPAVHSNDGRVSTVAVQRGGHRGGHRGGGTHRPAHGPGGGGHRPGHPGAPSQRPGYPGHRPGHPGTRPGHPGYRPGHPGYRPGHPGYRPGYRGGAVWVGRPATYGWVPGGAVAAGAALGFVTAATAAAWAGQPPQAGLCWFYTDPSRKQGFWDVCP